MTQSDQQESAVEAVESEAFAEVLESDVDRARRLLAEAERQLVASFGRNVPPVALATAAATIGTGYAVLAGMVVPSELVFPPGTDPVFVDEWAARVRQSDVESRPGDGEPVQLAVDDAPSAEGPAPKRAQGARRPKAAGRG